MVKRGGLKIHWPSAYAGSNPVPRMPNKMEKKILPLILLSVLCTASAQLLLKYALQNQQLTDINIGTLTPFFQTLLLNPYLILGLILFVLSAMLWLLVLSKAELSYAYPSLSISYVLTAVASWLLFNESLNSLRILGITIICIGVIALSRS